MRANTIRLWFLVHKWTSIVCTAFLLMLCVTGLPLIFHDEIDRLTEDPASREASDIPSSSDLPGLLPLDTVLSKALATRPGEVPVFMAFSNDSSHMTVTTAPAPGSPANEMTIQFWDRASGRQVGGEAEGEGVMHFILQLHTDMFLGLPGMLFLGAMGVLFLAAIVSGVVLYTPFMRKLDFGTLRTGRSTRLKWLDAHNLLGIVTLCWVTVVGLTGVINTLERPIYDNWRSDVLARMASRYEGMNALPPERYGSIDVAMGEAREALPNVNPQFIAFPGGRFSSKHHYAVFFQGDTPLTERILTPALIDAETGELTDVSPMPVATKALQISRPLHFGDYGGLPLKILWALLTLATIVVLGSGLYLWLGKRAPVRERVGEVKSGGETAGTSKGAGMKAGQ